MVGIALKPYNYATFPSADDVDYFAEFAGHLPVGERAPDPALLDLDAGATLQLSDVTRRGLTVIELGSLT